VLLSMLTTASQVSMLLLCAYYASIMALCSSSSGLDCCSTHAFPITKQASLACAAGGSSTLLYCLAAYWQQIAMHSC
jgi:hypothetical protein